MKVLMMMAIALVAFRSYADMSFRGIYGSDNRYEASLYPRTEFREYARSTAAMMNQAALEKMFIDDQSDRIDLMGESLGSMIGLCSEERFIEQISASTCSGFLISENQLATAGHCAVTDSTCRDSYWVFDYANSSETQDQVSVSRNNVYRCNKIVKRAFSKRGADYAVIELDRPVLDRQPLKLRTSGVIEDTAQLIVIGYPSGLPAKITDSGEISDNTYDSFIRTNLDTFGGNSGSAVLNAATGEVEGILVRGGQDYYYDIRKGCTRTVVCPEGVCAGSEDVTRIAEILK